jgi:hypothetical protein
VPPDLARTTYSPHRMTVYEVDANMADLVLFRIVRSHSIDDPVFENCFRSNYELQRPPRNVETRSAVIQMGISMYDRVEIAAETARKFRRLGEHIALVSLVPDRGINLARTGHPHHLTVWGRPEQLLPLVQTVYPVDEI